MTDDNLFFPEFRKDCLTDDDLFFYVSREGDSEKHRLIEKHFIACPDCRRALADLLEIMPAASGSAAEEIQQPDRSELNRTLALIRDVSRRENPGAKKTLRWYRWAAAAAVFLGIASLASWGLKDLYERKKSEEYYLQAKALLEQNYAGRSPGNLRLDLPFSPAPMLRNSGDGEALQQSAIRFSQALAVRGDMADARLGLACIYLNESKFESAREMFQQVLDSRRDDVRALIGRGVSQYEEAAASEDPSRRHDLLARALEDFNAAIEINPGSQEAHYNKIWALYKSGSYREALAEIDPYLARDKDSAWAEELKNLKARIRANQSALLTGDVRDAAMARNGGALERIARNAPHQVPAIVWGNMRRSLAMDPSAATQGSPTAGDLQWSASTLATAYRNATGDPSFEAFIDFYGGLSPPQRIQKKTLDETFQKLANLQQKEAYDLILQQSIPLERAYRSLHDDWQLFNLYHLRGKSYYMGPSDFDKAGFEYGRMLGAARSLNSPFLIAKAISSLASIKVQQRKIDETMRLADELRDLAVTHNLDYWRISAGGIFGKLYLLTGQYEKSLSEYTSTLGYAYRLCNELKIIETLEQLGDAYDRLENPREAEGYYTSALERFENYLEKPDRELPDLRLRWLNIIYKQGDLALRNGRPGVAESMFLKCLQALPEGMKELQARSRIGLAEVYLKQKRYGGAESMLDTAEAGTGLKQNPEIVWQAKFLRGRILDAEGESDGALRHYRESIEVLGHMRSRIGPADLRQSFFTDRYDPYKEIAALLYRTVGDKRQSLEFVNEAKSITLKEQLNLRNQEQVPGAAGRDGGEDIAGFRVVEYFFADDRLLIFVTEPGEAVETVSLPMTPDEMSRQVKEYIRSVRANDMKEFKVLSRRLYDELIAPVEAYALDGYPGTLLILPDGPLHLLTFAGLMDPEGRVLVEKNSIAYAPSRSVLRHCLSAGKGISPGDQPDVVLIDGTAGLPGAREELVYLENLYGGRAHVLGPKDLSEFSRVVSDSEILHFSGHAVPVQGKPVLMLQQYPQLAYLDSSRIGSWKLRRSCLVNLAGCSTGIGPVAEGEPPWGLVTAFLNAGAPAIVASLMPVDDASTEIFTRRFYQLLRDGTDKATALKKAQISMLNRSSGEMESLSWVPYILIGNPL